MPARENDSDVKRNVQRAGNACTKPSAVQNCPAPDLSNFSGPQTESQAGWIKSLSRAKPASAGSETKLKTKSGAQIIR